MTMCPDLSLPKNTDQTSKKSTSHEWFHDWFNSPYYFKLYQCHDEVEAQKFIDKFIHKLSPKPASLILDLACGRGRYSHYLASKGFNVTGLDIAEHSIEFAKQFENDHLSFFVHDMRKVFRVNYFDYVFNFFTSFGYFDSDKEHRNVVKNIGKGLKPDGKFVLDYFNSNFVLKHLLDFEVKNSEGLTFEIHRKLDDNGYICKKIEFSDGGRNFSFIEKVRAFSSEDFEKMFAEAGMRIAGTFGNYQLDEYNENDSERLILIGCKSVF